LEGFIAAKVVVEALRRAGPNPSRPGFIQAMESLHNYQMGGFKVDFSTQEHNGSNYVDLTFLGSQEWQP
jgi:ABC-type branched-subunit amino acid transport system substrate-binding protein